MWPQYTWAENWGAVPVWGRLGPHLIQCGAETYPMPSFILIHPTVWPQYTNIADRQTGQDRQWTDSIRWTVLQTVAQKLMALKILTQVQSPRPPKGNSLHKNMSYDVQIVKIGSPVFCTMHSLPFYPSPKILCFTILFSNQLDTVKSALSRGDIYISIILYMFLGPTRLSCISIVSAACAQHTTESPHTLQCVKCNWRYGDGAGNTVEENSSVFSLIRMC